MNGREQLDFIYRLSFNRFGGTENELRAAELILSEIKARGGDAELEHFTVLAGDVTKASLTVTEPEYCEIPVVGVARSGALPEGGIEADLLFAESGTKEDLANAAGKVVLVDNLRQDTYKNLVGSGAAAFLCFSGRYDEDPARTDIDRKLLREHFTKDVGHLPGLCMHSHDALKLVQSGATRVKVELEATMGENPSQNVVAEIKGTKYPDQIIFMTAHYDSTWYGLGAWDNASGSANLLAMYEHFLQNPPLRTVRFIWCGSEEQGLLGSKHHAENHEEDVKNAVFCINFDMTGTAFGSNLTMITGSEEMQNWVKELSLGMGYISKYSRNVHSSDSAPFALRGVPSVGVARDGQAGGHSRYDIPAPLAAEPLGRCVRFAKALSDATVNCAAEQIPVAREMPEDMMEKLYKYFRITPPEKKNEKEETK
ncbi:MAG: Zn-dependent exopeptidase M28 [Ruminococcaceae bacterium]|nr:Zn-dependent exopeptidase M28 [Oscillospiraceae bacterium]